MSLDCATIWGETNKKNLQLKESELAWAAAMLIYKSTCKVTAKYCPEVVVWYLSTYQYDYQVGASKRHTRSIIVSRPIFAKRS